MKNDLFKANYRISKIDLLTHILKDVFVDDIENIYFDKKKRELRLKFTEDEFEHMYFDGQFNELKNKKASTIRNLQRLYASIKENKDFSFYVYKDWDDEKYKLKIIDESIDEFRIIHSFIYNIKINDKTIISEYFSIPKDIRPTLEKFFADMITDSLLKEINTDKKCYITLNTRLNLYHYIVKRIKISKEIFEKIDKAYKKNN